MQKTGLPIVGTTYSDSKSALKAALAQKAVTVNRLFIGQTEFDAAFKDVDTLFLDVTEVPIERAKNQNVQREHYSGRKTTHAKMASGM